MNVPGVWEERAEVESTQTALAALLSSGASEQILLAYHQVAGRGRFGRPWLSREGESLTMSIAFGAYVGHPRPWLLGMACACASAEVLDCNIRWPNDLCLNGRKLGGILTELFPDSHGKMVPCVGIGINVGQLEFDPAIADRATSLRRENRPLPPIDLLAVQIVEQLRSMRDPQQWTDLEPLWTPRDTTPGKSYCLPNGDVAEAVRVGPGGELHCLLHGEARTVLAADSIFGTH